MISATESASPRARHIVVDVVGKGCSACHGSAENAVAALKAGAFDYVSKPVDRALLLERIHHWLSKVLEEDLAGVAGR